MARSLIQIAGVKHFPRALPRDWSVRYPKTTLARMGGGPMYDRDSAAISDRERIAMYLDAINTGALSIVAMMRISFGTRALFPRPKFAKLKVPTVILDAHREFLTETFNLPREPAFCDEPITAAKGFNAVIQGFQLEAMRDELIVRHEMREKNVSGAILNFHLAYRTIAKSRKAAFDYALGLILGNFSTDLCRCRLQTCAKFFLVEPAKVGRPRREYCSNEHREEFFRQQSGERVKRSRERAKARARKPK